MGGKITLAILRRFGYNSKVSSAGVMELVDVVDSKSTAGDSVPVRVRSPAPYRVVIRDFTYDHSIFLFRYGLMQGAGGGLLLFIMLFSAL